MNNLIKELTVGGRETATLSELRAQAPALRIFIETLSIENEHHRFIDLITSIKITLSLQ